METQAADFLHASGKLQTLLYKEEIESALRTPGMGGFFLLDLHDFPGQGTALVGVLDAFWDSKGYVTPAEFRRFCAETVPLARLDRRVFTTADTLAGRPRGRALRRDAARAARPSWRLVDARSRVVARGTLPAARRAGRQRHGPRAGEGPALAASPRPARYRLVAALAGTPFENDWDVWVYPRDLDVAVPAGVKVVRELDAGAEAALREGGRVVLLAPPGRVRGDALGRVELGLLEHLLEHRVDEPPGPAHARASCATPRTPLSRTSRPTLTATGSGGTS